MSDTNQHPAHTGDPVEPDAVSFGGIGWFIVILTGTVLASQLIVWGLYEWFDYRVTRADAPRSVLADPPTSPVIEGGRLVSGAERSPSPALLVDEPAALRDYHRAQQEALSTYGWIDRGMGVVRLPIDRAKDLVIERGLPTRPAPGGVE